jgi:hypothetical protein
MPLLEDNTASFIVRVWREQGESTVLCQEWRGSIEHVQSGHRSFFRDLRSIVDFMQPHLEHLGIEAPLRFWDVVTPDLFETPAEPSLAPPPPPASGRAGARKR